MVEKNNKVESSIDELTREELIEMVGDLKTKIRMQENFLVNVAHDLRNPINVILSILQAIKYVDKKEDPEVKIVEYRSLIRRNSLKMMKLIDNLIDTTRIEGNYYRLNKSMIDIVNLVENTIFSIDKYAEQRNLELVFDTNVEECTVLVDPQAIDRIVVNLLSNAIKFSQNGSKIMVNIFVDKEIIKISVKDNGPGIEEKQQKLIFNRFIQASQKKNCEKSGSGIGLDLVSCLTKLHGGNIVLKSQVNKGSEFIVSIPRIEGEVTKENSIDSSSKVQQLEVEFSDIYF